MAGGFPIGASFLLPNSVLECQEYVLTNFRMQGHRRDFCRRAAQRPFSEVYICLGAATL
jgi:hypothetical protein